MSGKRGAAMQATDTPGTLAGAGAGCSTLPCNAWAQP